MDFDLLICCAPLRMGDFLGLFMCTASFNSKDVSPSVHCSTLWLRSWSTIEKQSGFEVIHFRRVRRAINKSHGQRLHPLQINVGKIDVQAVADALK